tara:strand:+ start:9644 stop:10414 length:771 start_codon:yes stop_codon:yes gene_type:complete
MSNIISKNSKSNLERTQPNTKALQKERQESLLSLNVRTELNIWGRLAIIGCYSLLVFILGYKLAVSTVGNVESITEVEAQNEKILEKLAALRANGNGNSFRNEAELLRAFDSKIQSHMERQTNALYEKLDGTLDVNDKLSKFYKGYFAKRAPGSVSGDSLDTEAMINGNGVIQYSNAESRVLRHITSNFERKLKMKQLEEVNAFVASHKMSDQKNVDRLESLKTKHDVEMKRLESNHAVMRNKFYSDGYRLPYKGL